MPENAASNFLAVDHFPPPYKEGLPPEQRAAYERIEARRGVVPAPYIVLLTSPEIADLLEQLSSHIWNGVLPRHILEMVFLIAARHYHCRFQWQTHVSKAAQAGLKPVAITTIGQGLEPAEPADVSAAYRFIKMLQLDHKVTQNVFDEALAQFGQRGVAELIACCGLAASMAMLLNVRQLNVPGSEPPPF